MNLDEVEAELQKLRGNIDVAACECCFGATAWEVDRLGDYVRWEDIESTLKQLKERYER